MLSIVVLLIEDRVRQPGSSSYHQRLQTKKRKTNLVIASALSRIYGRLSKFSEKDTFKNKICIFFLKKGKKEKKKRQH